MKNDTDVVPDEAPLTLLNIKSTVCMDKNDKDNKHTSHIDIRVYFVRNSKNCKMHKIDWCERGLKLTEISTKNVGENDLNPRMKHIMVRLDNWYRTLVQEEWQDTGYYVGTRVI